MIGELSRLVHIHILIGKKGIPLLLIGKKQMMEIYRVATAEPYSFLTVDLLTKDPSKIFMKRFDSFLVPS